MTYYHSQGAALKLRVKMEKEALMLNFNTRKRYADDEERQELEKRIKQIREELKKL